MASFLQPSRPPAGRPWPSDGGPAVHTSARGRRSPRPHLPDTSRQRSLPDTFLPALLADLRRANFEHADARATAQFGGPGEPSTAPRFDKRCRLIRFGFKFRGGVGLTSLTRLATGSSVPGGEGALEPEAAVFVARLNQLACAHAGPEFTWSTISVSKTTKYGAHIDTQNLEGSLSAIFCLGEHSGGDLAVYSPSTKAWSSLHARGQWRTWDGKMPHFTRAFRGERFSIVFYTHRQCFRLSAEGRRALAALGFRYPSQEASGGGSRGGSGGPFAGDTTARAQALMAEALAALRVRSVGGEWTKSGASEAGAEAEASGVAFPEDGLGGTPVKSEERGDSASTSTSTGTSTSTAPLSLTWWRPARDSESSLMVPSQPFLPSPPPPPPPPPPPTPLTPHNASGVGGSFVGRHTGCSLQTPTDTKKRPAKRRRIDSLRKGGTQSESYHDRSNGYDGERGGGGSTSESESERGSESESESESECERECESESESESGPEIGCGGGGGGGGRTASHGGGGYGDSVIDSGDDSDWEPSRRGRGRCWGRCRRGSRQHRTTSQRMVLRKPRRSLFTSTRPVTAHAPQEMDEGAAPRPSTKPEALFVIGEGDGPGEDADERTCAGASTDAGAGVGAAATFCTGPWRESGQGASERLGSKCGVQEVVQRLKDLQAKRKRLREDIAEVEAQESALLLELGGA